MSVRYITVYIATIKDGKKKERTAFLDEKTANDYIAEVKQLFRDARTNGMTKSKKTRRKYSVVPLNVFQTLDGAIG